jgi:hypothetical protein
MHPKNKEYLLERQKNDTIIESHIIGKFESNIRWYIYFICIITIIIIILIIMYYVYDFLILKSNVVI